MNVLRYGNKGVISTIVDDDQMPTLENGQHVELIFNTLGVINRLNSQQIFEQSITFICNRVVEHIKTLTDVDEKFKLVHYVVNAFNDHEAKVLQEYYNNLLGPDKELFLLEIQEYGIFIHIPPLWEKEPLFDRIRRIYKDLTFLKPYDVYVNKFGRKIKIMRQLYIGEMYVLKLKQSSKKGFSARSTGSISKKGIPEKNNNNTTHHEPYSKTPIRVGHQENTNAIIGVAPEMVAKLHHFYRSSVEGRQQIGQELLTSTDPIDVMKIKPGQRNRNVDIFSAYMKALGLQLKFIDPDEISYVDTDQQVSAEYDGQTFTGTFTDIKNQVDYYKRVKEFNKRTTIVANVDDYDKAVDDAMKEEDTVYITVDSEDKE